MPKTAKELEYMITGGKISAGALKETLAAVKEGITLAELDKIAENYIITNGGEPSFKKVRGYHWTTCINLNEGLVHGIPNDRRVKKGDIVKVDLGAFYKGFHTDLSYSVEVETDLQKEFLEAGKKAMEKAIAQCIEGNRVGDISFAIQQEIESYGYSVSLDLTGHGVGKELHEDPYVPGYGKPNTGKLLKNGMTLAIEVIYQKGKPTIAYESDGWTIRTKDKSLAGLFEHTVAINGTLPIIVTA